MISGKVGSIIERIKSTYVLMHFQLGIELIF